MKKENELEGKLTSHFESGMEGIGLYFEDNINSGYDSLHRLEAGDALIVYKDKKIYWLGEITPKMAELSSAYYGTGSKSKKWTNMFYDKMDAKLIKK